MPRQPPRAANDPEKVFGPDRLKQLRKLLGPAGDRLIPAFANAAVNFQDLERETVAEAGTRHRAGKSHTASMRRLEASIVQLQKPLASAIGLIADAKERGYVPRSAPLGHIGRLHPASEIEQRLNALLHDSVAVREGAGHWRRRAEADAKRKRGRKVGDRPLLADWLAERFGQAGLRVTKTRNGPLWTTVLIMYEASGVHAPDDVSRDVFAAVDRFRQVR